MSVDGRSEPFADGTVGHRRVSTPSRPPSASAIGNYDLPMWFRVRGSVSRTPAIAAVPVVAGTLSETAAVVGMVAFWTNTWQPWSLFVANGIA